MVIATSKRITFTGGGTTRKKGDPTKEMDAALLALDGPVDEDVCWEVYHLDEDNCVAHVPPQSKPRNCKPNPYCIHRLGIEKFTKLLQSKDSGDAVEAMVRRDPAIQPCGLVNYGNYCYVNSFLQIWFNNLRFRQCVYDWRTDPDWKKPADAKFDIQAVMGCLQRLFLTLQFTPFETTDAREFIKLLRLDDQQQDIQEFHTLFFDNVERALAPHPNGRPIRDTIQQLFLSRMNQTMNCDCGYESAAGTEYRSLPIIIEGYNSLPPAIQNFFRPENVADYKCSKCGRVGYMIKGVNFDALPQVLIIQLNRYIYDNAKGRHRKLNTPISYPRVLKAELLQPGAADNDEYELCAVMIHDGQSAQSGHYYDIIREPSTKQWFTYNDRHVQLEKKAPGYEENKEPKEGGKSTADQRGCYALIYQRKAIGNERGEHNDALRMPPVEDVQAVRFKLERDFGHQSKAGSRTRRLWEHRIVQRHAFLSQLFNDLEVKNGHDLFDEPETIAFIPTSLLIDVFAKEFAAVKDMHNLDIEAAPMDDADLSPPRAENKGCSSSSNSNVKLKRSKEDGESRSGSGSAKSMQQQKDNNVDDNQEQEEDDLLDANFDYSAYEHIYAPEPPKEVHFVLCKHGHVPLDAVLRGELKAVKTKGARRMIKELAVQFYVHRPKEMMAAAAAPSSPSKAPPKKSDKDSGGTNTNNNSSVDKPSTSAFVQEWDRPAAAAEVPTKDQQQQQGGPPAVEAAEDLYVVDRRLRTGDDLCTECVEALRTEALFREQLHQIDLLMADTMRALYLRTFDPNRVTPNPPREPPADAVWVSCEHLKQYKKIATAQMQQDGRFNYERGGEEPAEKRAKNSDDEAEDAEASSGSQDDNNNNVQLQLIEVMASTNTGTNHDDDGSPFDDSEQQMAGTSLDGRLDGHISAEVLAVDAEMARMAAAGDAHSPPIEEMEESIKDKETPATAAAVDDDQPPRFNDKLYCKHGNLSTVSKRVWLRKNEWNLLAQNLRHFDEPFPCTAQECHECREESQDLEQVRQYSMNQLQGLIDAITPLLKRITGRKWESHELGQMYPYILCKKFVDQTGSIISKAKQKGHVEIPRICQDCLLCKEHGLPFLVFHAPQQPAAQDGGILGILFSGLVKNKSDEEESIAIPLFSTEWEQLLQAYRTHVPEYPEPRAILFLENGQCPDFCDNCHYQHNIDEEARRFIYPEGADIYVKSKGDESEDQLQAKATSSSSTTSTMTTRRGAQKDMHKIKMRSDQTVMDLKMELMHKTNQSPNDQLLYLDDRVLDNQMTLEQALVAPNNQENPLILIVQQRQQQDDSESGGAAEGSGRRRRPLEKGFKDTALS